MSLRYFKASDFACPCCGKNNMDPDFLRQLDAARDWAGVPFRITSACRCAEHNAKVGGEPKSRHMAGTSSGTTFGQPFHTAGTITQKRAGGRRVLKFRQTFMQDTGLLSSDLASGTADDSFTRSKSPRSSD